MLTVLTLLAGVAFSFGLVRAIASEIPTLDPAQQQASKQVDSVVYAVDPADPRNRRVLAVLRGDESRVLLSDIAEVAPIMRQAIVSVEDRRFYEHNGVDVRGIARAVWQDIRSQSVVEGGSTITQQFVKNAYVTNRRTIARKVREAALAWQLEQRWSKDRILLAYLNTIYFGNGAYGVQQAARTYFGKGAARLTLAEAALLAGLPADPSLYDPVQHPRASRLRRRYVLQTMFDQGKITERQLQTASDAPLPKPGDVRLPGTRGPAQYFVNYVKDQLVAKYGAGQVFGGGLKVTTTIDLRLQELARRAIDKVLTRPGGPSAALVAIDPATGAVRAMVGGTNYRESQFNLATQAERQPGSSFKPIVLATALRQGISPVTQFESKPVEIDAGDRIWRVTNYEGSYLGRVDLARAMVSSDNAVYAQLTKLVGPKGIVATAHALGIRSPLDPYFSIGLGAVAVNPLDMTRAYATFANDGKRVDGTLTGDKPRVIEQVEFARSGRVLRNEPVGEQVLPPPEAQLLTSILERVVAQGTGKRAALPGLPAAGKTGTTDNYGDAWFVGYTPQLAVAVWVGYPDELKPMLTEFGGKPVTGGTLPAEIWKAFMEAALKERKQTPQQFAPAPYIPAQERRIVWRGGSYKLDNGLCRDTLTVAYFAGRGPQTQATCYANEVAVPLVVGLTAAAAQSRLAAQPLDAEIIGVPAQAGKRPGYVLRQEPRSGFLSARDSVRLYVTRPDPRYGLLPNLVGSSVKAARERLRRLQARPRIAFAAGPAGIVLEQSPEPGVAAGPGLRVTLVVAPATATTSP
ncbi:penicillin-binding protein, 1A family [Gaiella occulta]|uniref:Penicillin-binding protein, 1A family n=1 Tax=Gaiella occulta TaxID=1002870 RepID=A0A7M2Z0G0_9ACTN|nr:penicillin-binding protein, 1A family [Gaiella occulta]